MRSANCPIVHASHFLAEMVAIIASSQSSADFFHCTTKRFCQLGNYFAEIFVDFLLLQICPTFLLLNSLRIKEKVFVEIDSKDFRFVSLLF